MNNQLDVTLPREDLAELMQALQTVRDQLPFLVGLSAEERRKLPKLGIRSQTFTTRALDMATQHSQLMPRSLDVEAARRDLALFEALNPLLQAVNNLRELLEDTQMVAGSEAYAAARLAYSSVKVTGRNMGLDEVVDDLAEHFRRRNRSEAVEEVEVG